MRRSAGVTASAVVTILGAVLLVLGAAACAATALIVPRLPQQPAAQPPPPAAMLLAIGAFFAVLGAGGIATGIGVLRLRRWARYSILIFSGVAGISAGLVLLIVPFLPIPSTPEAPDAAFYGKLAIFIMYAPVLLLSGWWIWLFNREKIRAQFSGAATATGSADIALTVRVIAVLFAVGGLSSIVGVLLAYPTILLGFLVTGWAARLTYVFLGISQIAITYLLWRRRPIGQRLAIAYLIFGFANISLMLLAPGRLAAMLATMQLPPEQAQTTIQFMPYMLGISIVVTCVLVWLLIRARPSFAAS